MLCVTRRVGEEIVIGDSRIIVTVIDIRGSVVRLGIQAPADVTIHRREIFDEIGSAPHTPRGRGNHVG